MPISVKDLVAQIKPERTVLLFGAGASIPSHAPSVQVLQQHFETAFGVKATGFTLAEQTAIIEAKIRERAPLIKVLRKAFRGLTPTGALLNLPLYDWKSLFTTNYEHLIEDSYKRKDRPLTVYSSNFDFGTNDTPDATKLFKLHGTIEKDVVDGNQARIVLTSNDYDAVSDYREHIYNRLAADLAGAHLIVIGHSLADPDIKGAVDRALDLNAKSGGTGRISVMSYSRDEDRAALLESRRIEVCFGGLDDFFAALTATLLPPETATPRPDDPLAKAPALRPTTIDVGHDLNAGAPNVSAMFNGWPATYADVKGGFTFARDVAASIARQFDESERFIAVVLGPSGAGKTTAARQVMAQLVQRDYHCFEHKIDQSLRTGDWRTVAAYLKDQGRKGCLLIDDAHNELGGVNDLIDHLTADDNRHLRLIIISSKNHWHPRVKTPSLFKNATEYSLNRVSGVEIDRLLDLAEQVEPVRLLVEDTFRGFSRGARRLRLIERCEADMFVCLKNIFSTDKLDDIILREYAGLSPALQEVYKVVAAMEAAGIHVHRQLVIRLLGIGAMHVQAVLAGLSDIIHEEDVDAEDGIFAWRGRHLVIMNIIADHKYYDQNNRFALFARVIDNISPTYDIEIRTLRALCNMDSGLERIGDRRDQNVLLRKMLSVAPRERVPRHRLIRNLIELGDYDQAETEIRLFEKDFRLDGPAMRYKIDLAVARAVRSPGLMDEDRVTLLQMAIELATAAANRFRANKSVISAYCYAGLEFARLTKDRTAFDRAIGLLKEAEDVTGDPDISRRISRLEMQIRLALQENDEPVAVAVAVSGQA